MRPHRARRARASGGRHDSIATTAFNAALERPARSSTRRSDARHTTSSGRPPAPAARARRHAEHAARSPPPPARSRPATTTCVELTEQALARIAQDEWTGFVEVIAEDALTEARARDAELRAGRRRGPLHGIPVSVKDVIDVRGVRTRCGSRRLRRDARPTTPTPSTCGARPAP